MGNRNAPNETQHNNDASNTGVQNRIFQAGAYNRGRNNGDGNEITQLSDYSPTILVMVVAVAGFYCLWRWLRT